MGNLWTRFRALTPEPPLRVATVTAHNPDGTSTLTTPEGGVLRVRGQDVAVGLKAFYRRGRVEGEAPDLTAYTVEV